jgi:hypothetical protein
VDDGAVTDCLFRPPRSTPEPRAGQPPRPRTEKHGRKKWAYYYDPDSVERQRVFFD